LLQLILFIFIIGCSPKIKSITEYNKNDNNSTKSRVAKFDKKGNKTLERNFENQRSNSVFKIEYLNGKKTKETDCDYFEKQDTCVVRQFSFYEYNPKENLKTQTMHDPDSAVRFIRKSHKTRNREVITTNSWEMFPTKDPNPENAIKLTDSVFYDSKRREIKRLHFNGNFKETWSEKFQYSKNGYTKIVSGNRMDTTLFHVYSKLEKLANKKHIDIDFKDATSHTYEFNYH
jgi:hypothetical protein